MMWQNWRDIINAFLTQTEKTSGILLCLCIWGTCGGRSVPFPNLIDATRSKSYDLASL